MDSAHLDDSELFTPAVLENCLPEGYRIDGLNIHIQHDVDGMHSAHFPQMSYSYVGRQWLTVTARIFAKEGFTFSNVMDKFPERIQPMVRRVNIMQLGATYCAEVELQYDYNGFTGIIRELYAANYHRVFYDEIKKVFAE